MCPMGWDEEPGVDSDYCPFKVSQPEAQLCTELPFSHYDQPFLGKTETTSTF